MRKLILVAGIMLAALNALSAGVAVRADSIIIQFSPTNISGRYPLSLWLDATQVATPTDGTQQNWQDVSGSGNDATNSTANKRPIWKQNGLNNKPTMRFDGTTQFLRTPGILNNTFNNNFTVFLVTGNKRSTNNGAPLCLGDSGNLATGTNLVNFTQGDTSYSVASSGPNQFLNLQAGMVTNMQPVIQVLMCSSTNTTFYVNGCRADNDGNGSGHPSVTYPYNRFYAFGLGSSTLSQPVGVGCFLNSGALFAGFDGDISEVIIYKGSLTPAEIATVQKYLFGKWFDSQNGPAHIVFAGDSITYGFLSTNGLTYPAQTMALLGGVNGASGGKGKWMAENIGVSGFTVASNSLISCPGLVNTAQFTFLNQARTPNDIAVLFGGANDGDRYFDTNIFFTNYVRWCQAARQAGYKVVACTVLPRTVLATATTNQFEVFRAGINPILRANYQLFADALADFGGDATMGTFSSSSNLLYYGDGCHPTALGYAIMATNAANAIQSIAAPGSMSVVGNLAITVGASPFNYTNNDGAREFIFVSGGTVSAVAINGTSVLASGNTSVPLQSGEYVTVTYSVAPTMRRKPY